MKKSLKTVYAAAAFILMIGQLNAQSWLAQTPPGMEVLKAVDMSGSGTNPNLRVTIGLATGTNPTAQFHTTGTVRLAGITQDDTQNRIMVQDANGNVRWRNAVTLNNTLNNWLLTGNNNTTAVNNILGTLNNFPVRFFTNNIHRATMDNTGLFIHPNTPGFVLPNDGTQLYACGKIRTQIFGAGNNGVGTAAMDNPAGPDLGPTGIVENRSGDSYFRGFWGVVIDKYGGGTGLGDFNYQNGYLGGPGIGSFSIRTRMNDGLGNFTNYRTDLFVDRNGNVGIGANNTAPSTQLHTTGGVRFQGLVNNAAAVNTVVSDANGNLFIANGIGSPINLTCSTANFIPRITGANAMNCSIIQQGDNLANCAGGTHSGIGINGAPVATANSGSTCHNIFFTVNGSAFASGGVWIASDKTVKKDVSTINNGLDKVLQLRGVNYEFDNKKRPELELPSGKTAGFIAQELQEIIPEAVGVTESGLHIVNYDIVLPYMVAAIQEQNSVIEDQRKQLTDMEQRLQALEAKLTGAAMPQLPQGTAPKHQLKVSPNPFGDQLKVSYSLNDAAWNHEIRFKLSDATGKEVFVATAKEAMGELTIDSSKLPSGVYFLGFYANGKLVETSKVTK